MPKISIVTINLNNKEGLRKTIESVIGQAFTDYEYVIIDGGSTDGSVDVIKEYAYKITYWVSEPDTGIYSAMNKGLRKASGEYCLLLNSGDILIDDRTLSEIAPFINGNTDIVCGSTIMEIGDYKYIKKPFDKLRMSYLYKKTLPHQACFIRHNLFTSVGYYNENNQVVSDWEFLVNCAKHGVTYTPVEKSVSQMQADGISTVKSPIYLEHLKERELRREFLFMNYLDDMNELNFLRNKIVRINFRKAIKFLKSKIS